MGPQQKNWIDQNNSKPQRPEVLKEELKNIENRRGEHMEIKAYLAEEQGNEEITDHFKVKEFACKDGTPYIS